MNIAMGILAFLAGVAFLAAYKKKDGSHKKGLEISKKTFINMFPLLLVAFIMAGFLQVVVPPEFIQEWLGEQAGLKGILIGSVGGALIPGGPYVAFPIIATIFQSGAGIGTAVAFIVGWSVWGVINIPFELALIGSRFTMLRIGLVLIIPPLSGILASVLSNVI